MHMTAAGKWRPPLWLVLGGALAVTLALSYAGLVALRYLGPEIGFRRAALLLGAGIALATLVLALLLARLLLRPVTALAQAARAIRHGAPPAPLDHYGTRELRALGASVLDMGRVLQNREATIRSFTDHVTHELKTPVSAIAAAAELLAEGDLAPEDRRLLDQISGANRQMQAQLAALRAVAAAREPAFQGQTDLDSMAPALRTAHPELALQIAGGTVALPLSAAGLRVVLDQLLGNAARHGAGTVRLTATPGRLVVTDDGPGVSPGNRDRIFAPFFTTARDTGGTGMGLTIARNVMQAHGGEISLLPDGPGANFDLRFPD